MKLKFQRGDLLAVGLVVLLAAAVALAFLPHNRTPENAQVQILQDGRLLRELPLAQDSTVEIEAPYRCTVEIRGGQVAVTASSCPGEDCVHSGAIRRPGRSIVCLPNRLEVRISGTSDVDFVVG